MTPFIVDYYQEQSYIAPASFQIKEELGCGDKGVVYLAEDAMGMRYALKVYRSAAELIEKGFPPEVVPYYFDEQGRSRMAQREYELSLIFTHPAFVKVYGSTVVEGNSVLIMEYIEGKLINEISDEHKPAAFKTAVEGLLFALARGYISNDLFSGNAMIDKQGKFKFIDLDSFDKIDQEVEGDTIENCLDSHRFFLSDLAEDRNHFDKVSRKYYSKISKHLEENLSPDNLSLITDYLVLISCTSACAP